MSLQLYTQGLSPYDMPIAGTTPQGWWQLVAQAGGYPDLVRLGTAMADAVPHAASLERIFSLMGWLHSKLRNRQSNHTTTAMTTIRTHWQRRTAKVIPANTMGQPYDPVTATAATPAATAAAATTAAVSPFPAQTTAAASAFGGATNMSATSQAPTPATEQPPATPQPLEDVAWKEAVAQFADQVALDEEADASMWQDLPADVDQLADADELGNMLEALYKADLSDELAPDAADLCVSSVRVQASNVFDLHDPFFDVANENIVVPEEIDLSLQPTGRSDAAYDAAALVDRMMG